LFGREVVVNERGPDASNLVGTHRRADAAAANCHTTIDFSRSDSACQRGYKVWVVVTIVLVIGSKVDHFMFRMPQLSDQLLFQTKSRVVGCNAHSHEFSSQGNSITTLSPQRGRPARSPGPGEPARRVLTDRRRANAREVRPCRRRSRATERGGRG